MVPAEPPGWSVTVLFGGFIQAVHFSQVHGMGYMETGWRGFRVF